MTERTPEPRGLLRLFRQQWWRDLWLLITTVVVYIAIIGSQDASTSARDAAEKAQSAADKAQDASAKQAEGRRIASGVTCAAISAVIDAGRTTITSGTVIRPAEFERNLEKLGLPPRSVRARGAQEAANAYASFIARKVVDEAHLPGVVNKDGTLNCRRLKQAIGVPP